MALPGHIDAATHAALPELIRNEYTKIETGFVPNITPTEVGGKRYAFEDVAGLRSSLQEERNQRTAFETKYKAFEALGIVDPVATKADLDKVASISSMTPTQKAQEQLEAQERQLTQKHSQQLKPLEDRNRFLQTAVEKNIRKAAAISAIAEHKGREKLLLPTVIDQIKVIEENGDLVARVVDEKGNVRLTMKQGQTGPMGISELVESLKTHNDYSAAFDGTGSSGGGTTSSSGRAGGTSTNGVHYISKEDAKDTAKYRAARDAATAKGLRLEIAE